MGTLGLAAAQSRQEAREGASIATSDSPSLTIITDLLTQEVPPVSPRRRIPASARSIDSVVSHFGNIHRLCYDNDPPSQSRSTSLAFTGDNSACSSKRMPPDTTMKRVDETIDEEREAFIPEKASAPSSADSRPSLESSSSVSTTSLVLENLNTIKPVTDPLQPSQYRDNDSDLELPRSNDKRYAAGGQHISRGLRRALWITALVAIIGWAFALFVFLAGGQFKHASALDYDHETPMKGSGKRITLEQIQKGQWQPRYASIAWAAGPNGEDGLLLEINQPGKDYLVVEDIHSLNSSARSTSGNTTLLKSGWIQYNGTQVWTDDFWISPDMKHVLLMAKREKVFRHSFVGLYFILDVETQKVQPLDPSLPDARIQLAQWSPQSDSVVFTRDNNLYLRSLQSDKVTAITNDGGPEYFYGIPDWAYEEEVFGTNTATWWARDGRYLAFLRTNETVVPEYPVQYFLSRPSGKKPVEGLENYPEVKEIKYPKAGAPNPVVDMLFYDISRGQVFTVDIAGGFPDEDRIIFNTVWADNGKVLVSESNRESDRVRVVLVDVNTRTGQTVRTVDLRDVDGGWIEPTQHTRYIPADPANGRPFDGYVDTVVAENGNHLAYFSPLNTSTPVMLTKGEWEVDGGPAAVDLKNNLVYFVAAREAPTQRHLYSVKLDGSSMQSLVPTSESGYWSSKFSTGAGYISLFYEGPGIPFQKVVSTPVNPEKIDQVMADNKALAQMASSHELPQQIFQNVTFDGETLQVVERRPPHFDPKKKYPVLFYLYGGPGSQMVNHKFHVDFQSYIAGALGYIVVTVDGRGTGYIGRKARTIVRNELGKYEAHDQIATAKMWAQKSYVDASRMAIWGWSYGGFMTLKVLETDAGETFRYGMAVAPVTDWRFYDSIYTERYMRMPQHNAQGYDNSAISNVTAMAQNVRFLIMHGVADDNVHMQNTLTLLDKFDLAGIENYDVHFFPDSDHSIFFHNANHIVWDKLSNWLINAFNGEWYRTEDPKPIEEGSLDGE
ncbi:putative dipeptidyl-aminopeptidase B [Exophiala dermatitidis]